MQFSSKVKSLYEILGLSPRTATARSIKQQYYRLSFVFHPDRNRSPSARSNFAQISEAYRILGNPVKRQEYDRIHGYTTRVYGKSVSSQPPYAMKKTVKWEKRHIYRQRTTAKAAKAATTAKKAQQNYISSESARLNLRLLLLATVGVYAAVFGMLR